MFSAARAAVGPQYMYILAGERERAPASCTTRAQRRSCSRLRSPAVPDSLNGDAAECVRAQAPTPGTVGCVVVLRTKSTAARAAENMVGKLQYIFI